MRSAIILSATAIWWHVETKFFGWNMAPGSVAELYADGLVLLGATIGAIVWVQESRDA